MTAARRTPSSLDARLSPLAIGLVLASACSLPLRTLTAVPRGADGCATLARWAEEKQGSLPQRAGESGADDDASEALACFRREKNEKGARATLLSSLVAQARQRAAAPVTAKTGGFEDGLARKLAALALSAHAKGELDTFQKAQDTLGTLRGRAIDLDRGVRKAVGSSGEAVTMLETECFYCSRTEAYGAQNGERVEQLGRWAGLSYVRRDDGREQFLVATRLIAEGQRPPQEVFAEAMRRRGRTIEVLTAAQLAKRAPAAGEESSLEAPLFHLALRGFAFGDVRRTIDEAGPSEPGLRLTVPSEAGPVVVRFPPKLLERAARDRRFVAPPDGVDAVVRYEGKEGDSPRYRAVILRHEDGVAEGP